LKQLSPVKFAGEAPHTEEIIDQLFPANPLLCVAKTKTTSVTRYRQELRGKLTNYQFIVPSPMTKIYGRTTDGRASMRTLTNTGARRFLVVEFDSGTFDEHAALLCSLSRLRPLSMVVHSGNKSLHGWFYCEGVPESTLHTFMQRAVKLGAGQNAAAGRSVAAPTAFVRF